MIEYLPLVLTGLGIAASITYYAMVLRDNSKARQREMVYQKYQSHSLEYTQTYVEVVGMTDWDTVEEFHMKYGSIANPNAWARAHRLCKNDYSLSDSTKFCILVWTIL